MRKCSDLQNQLFESVKTERGASRLAAIDFRKMGEINKIQRELFASMPRRIGYETLGLVSQIDYAGIEANMSKKSGC